MKWFSLIMMVATLAGSGGDLSHLPKSAIRKINKVIDKEWPDQEITKNEVILLDDEKTELSFKVHSNTLFELINKNETVGYIYLDKAPSKFDKFDYMVMFDTDLTIVQAKILVYREDYGGEIGSPRWLKQFTGKNSDSKMKLGEDIQGISGATLSCRSATRGIKKLALRIAHLREKGIL